MSVNEKEQDIKKLGRAELIEVIYQLKKSEQNLEEQVESLQAALADKNLRMANVGSVAEAALALTDIFTNAQTAADSYLEEIRSRRENVEAECDKRISDTQAQADAALREAQEKADTVLREAQEKADEILQDALRRKETIDGHCKTTRAELQRVQETLKLLNDAIPSIMNTEGEDAQEE